MKTRIVTETDENEQPALVHAVKGTSSTKYDGVGYFTVCGEVLLSDAKRASRRTGIPTCIRCYVQNVKVSWP